MDSDMPHVQGKLKQVPRFWRQELLEFLNDEGRFEHLKQMLSRSCLMLEGGGYQMPIQSVEELLALKQLLETSAACTDSGPLMMT
jgi:hypothetical protein